MVVDERLGSSRKVADEGAAIVGLLVGVRVVGV